MQGSSVNEPTIVKNTASGSHGWAIQERDAEQQHPEEGNDDRRTGEQH